MDLESNYSEGHKDSNLKITTGVKSGLLFNQ